MKNTLILLAVLFAALPAQAQAQDDPSIFRIGNDVFAAGSAPTVRADGVDDAFAAGDRVTLAAPVAGSAHLAGRRVEVEGAVGDNLYAAGGDVRVHAPVSGNATLAGYSVEISSEVTGNTRAAGSSVLLTGAIGGTALISGQDIRIEGTIAGDTVLGGESITFGPDARIDGTLTVYSEDVDEIDVPESVASADRVERRNVSLASERGPMRPGWGAIITGFLSGLVVVALLSGILASLAPHTTERMRITLAERPWRTFWMGFLSLSCLVGASILLALTLVGIVVAPLVLVLAFVAGAIGYLFGVYLTGRLLWSRFGQFEPDSVLERLAVAGLGALIIGLLALLPFAGWLIVMIVTLTGLGALTVILLNPEFEV